MSSDSLRSALLIARPYVNSACRCEGQIKAIQAIDDALAAVHHEAPEPNQPKAEGESILREALARLVMLNDDFRTSHTAWAKAWEAARSALAGMKE